MRPDDDANGKARRIRGAWLTLAGVLQVLGMLCVMSALVKLTPITMTLSVGGAGMLLGAACGIYVVVVVLELRRRDLF